MTKYFLFMILSACFVLLIIPAFAAASADHGDRVCIYKHDNFHGHEQCYRPGEEVSDLKHIDINSVRVFGHALRVEVAQLAHQPKVTKALAGLGPFDGPPGIQQVRILVHEAMRIDQPPERNLQ